MLVCGKTSDILVCPNCGYYHDGYPSGYTSPNDKRCEKCNHCGLVYGTAEDILKKLNLNLIPLPSGAAWIVKA